MKRKSGFTRREFVKRTAVAGAGLALPWQLAQNQASAAKVKPPPPPPPLQTPLNPKTIPKFVQPLPTLMEMDVVDGTTGAEIPVEMREFQAEVLPVGTALATPLPPGQAPKTWAWGYFAPGSTRKSYIGPVVVAKRGTPTQMRFINNLGNAETSNVLAYSKSVDVTLMWADPLNNEQNSCAEQAAAKPGQPATGACASNYTGPIPACVHIHGGEVPSGLDGGPDAWYTSDTATCRRGHGYYTHPGFSAASNEAVYRYPNTQESAPVWFHDHTLGATRLNVYAGLAGAYYLVDPDHDPKNLPPLEALVIQDRMFDTNGQLYFPAGVPFIPNPDHPFWVPEFEGDVICVNGKAWPFMNVEPKRYQFLIINGSNARTYEMFLNNQTTGVEGPAIWQIGTDGGYLDVPAKIDPLGVPPTPTRLILMPGERATIIIDFAGQLPGTSLILRNIGKHPYPNGITAKGGTTGQIMQFKVVPLTLPDTSYDPASLAPLRPASPIVRLVEHVTGTPMVTPVLKRQLTLNEVMALPVTVGGIAYPGGPLEVVVNNTKYTGIDKGIIRPDFMPVDTNGQISYYSEIPTEGTVELWEIINLTADAHPMHLHLVQFQVLNRQTFDVPGYLMAYALAYGGVIKEAWGPPFDYTVANGDGALGGNPAVTPFLKGAIRPPRPSDAGWKDTVRAMPGEITRILVRWAPTDIPAGVTGYYPFKPCTNNNPHGYVWHCHIVDHEDNEMMRPFFVAENTSITPVRTFEYGTDY